MDESNWKEQHSQRIEGHENISGIVLHLLLPCLCAPAGSFKQRQKEAGSIISRGNIGVVWSTDKGLRPLRLMAK